MERLNASNNAGSILTQTIRASDTVITVQDASTFPDAPFLLTIYDDDPSLEVEINEIVKVNSISGNQLTVDRGQEGTTARDWDAGFKIENRFTAGMYDGLTSKKEFMSHKAESATDAHNATNISFADSQMQATNVKEGILEAFLLGNSRKTDLVDKLLLVDDSLPIDYNSTWQDVLASISQISTGKKWASGTATSSSTSTTLKSWTGSNVTGCYLTTVTGLGFKPNLITIYNNNLRTFRANYWSEVNAYGSSAFSMMRSNELYLILVNDPIEVSSSGFTLATGTSNEQVVWIAYE